MRMQPLRLITLATLTIASHPYVSADNYSDFIKDAHDDFKDFFDETHREYLSFRDSANIQFAERLSKNWERRELSKPVPKPKDRTAPPIVAPIKDNKPHKNTQPVKVPEVMPPTPPMPAPQPTPIEPIKENPIVDTWKHFSFYGTPAKVRWDDNLQIKCSTTSPADVAAKWLQMSKADYDNLISDCLCLRTKLQLDDWPYLELLKSVATATHPSDTNAQTLLTAFLYCQSGYAMRLGVQNGKLVIFAGSRHIIYDRPYLEINGTVFTSVSDNSSSGPLEFANIPYPSERLLSLEINRQPKLQGKIESRVRISKIDPDINTTVKINTSLINLYDNYPTSMTGGNLMTRWAQYANTPLDSITKASLYPTLRKNIDGISQQEAGNKLLHFVQTAFTYEYDNKVWGADRAFFAEESLYYPYSDCEDRSILFSRLVRDIMNLDAALIYYPGHLATAIAFTDKSIPGDWITINGHQYLICDPTYINASIGRTMPGMDNSRAKAIILRR